MNLIIVSADEVDPAGRVVLGGRRARHVIDVLAVKVGRSVRVGRLNDRTGRGVVEAITPESVTLACVFDGVEVSERRIDLMLAMPRPKVMKRLWAPLASLGVRRIVLTNAARVDKNYFATHWIQREQFEPRLVEGLEQAGTVQLPEVSVVRRLKPFIEDQLDGMFPHSARLLAHPGADVEGVGATSASAPILLAVGPEPGWTPYEIELLTEHGFRRISMGQRTLRTDVACIGLVSMLRSRHVTARTSDPTVCYIPRRRE